MKVLLTIHSFFPRHYHGTERHTLDLAKSLQKLGCDVVVLTANYDGDTLGRVLTEYVYEDVRVLALDIRLAGGSGFRFQYERPQIADILGRILCEEKPDLVHCCHLMHLGATVIGFAKAAKLPVVCSLTDFYGICWTTKLLTSLGSPCDGPLPDGINCFADFYVGASMRALGRFGNWVRYLGPFVPHFSWVMLEKCFNSWLGRRLELPAEDIRLRKERLLKYYQNVDVFLTASDCVKDTYISHGFPADRFKKIPFGIGQPDESEKVALGQRYAEVQKGAPLVFGFIGQIARHKGVHLLVKAFQRAHLPNAELHIYGDLNQDREAMNRILKAKDADPRIKCLGTFPGNEIYQKLSSIHVMCVPSQWAENAPLVLLNGLASKTILIVAPEKGLVEFVQDGASGLVFETNNVESLTIAMRDVSERRNCLLELSRSMAGYRQTGESYAQQICQIYQELLSQRKTSGGVEIVDTSQVPMALNQVPSRSGS
ncbi:MAG: glycosyltransferase [Desulfomonile tiedjei]|uniref:Glycosyltransferase n=1 Tax=Desulfomonile tiedjei TaxID=2358 RepID=A0A9D6VAZ7_9BACT|nr:glycosyltransferase [Desulfomonile tiedjei]